MLLDEPLNGGQQRVPAGFRRAPVAVVQFVRQPRRQDLQCGGGKARGVGRGVAVDVAGELEQEL